MTNNKQQTAVEWLFGQIPGACKSSKGAHDALEQAKEMEKEQAIKLYYEYELYVMMNESDEMITESIIMTFGQFYKQTYGGGEQ
jgi:hypothetical protein